MKHELGALIIFIICVDDKKKQQLENSIELDPDSVDDLDSDSGNEDSWTSGSQTFLKGFKLTQIIGQNLETDKNITFLSQCTFKLGPVA